MMGFGFLIMLAGFAVPMVAIVAIIVWLAGRRDTSVNPTAQPIATPAAGASTRACLHCGVSLQTDWTHYPQCGAPVKQEE